MKSNNSIPVSPSSIVLVVLMVVCGLCRTAAGQQGRVIYSEPRTVQSQSAIPLDQDIVYYDDNSGIPFESYADGDFIGEVYAGPETTQSWVQLAPQFTRKMLDFQNRQTDKETLILEHVQDHGGQPQLTLGGQFRASALYGKTNRADKFSYLGRFPADFEGRKASDLRLVQANQNATVSFTPVVHGYFETLFSDVFSFNDPKQGSFQVRQAYIVIGNFDRTPVFGFIGKKNIGFGGMSTLSPFTQAVPWHYFAVLAEGGGLGYDDGVVNVTATALNGSRGIRVSDSQAKGDINNFAVNALVRWPTQNSDHELHFGAGYILGTIYNAGVAEHLDSDLFGPNNGAWDLNAYLRRGRLHLAAEYVQTIDPWPVTGHEVLAYRAEAGWDTWIRNTPGRISVSWSEGVQGAKGTQFEFNRQLVVGYMIQPHPNASFSFEYVRSSGFAPLINITRVSDIDVIQDSAVVGATLTF